MGQNPPVGGLRRLAGFLVVTSALCVASVGAAVASRDAVPAAPIHRLVPIPAKECPQPRKIVGRACVDYAGSTLLADWSFSDGAASWDTTGATNTYRWTVPATIGPGEAPVMLGLTAVDKTGGRSCPAIGIRGIGVRAGEDVNLGLEKCADKINGPASASAAKTLHLRPPGLGTVYLLVGLQDGPQFLYRYVDAPKPKPPVAKPGSPKCARPAWRPSASHGCRYTVSYAFRVVDKVGRVATGHGELTGTRLAGLDAVPPKVGDGGNLIRWKDGTRVVLLEVEAATYAKKPGRPTYLVLSAKVFASSSSSCKKGTDVQIILTDGARAGDPDATAKDQLEADRCDLSYPNPGLVTFSTVVVNLKTTTE